jgi:glycosyltransferase involved in cell wall biosynthesis
MGSWVELTGRLNRDEIKEVYRRADVFVMPANLESFGIAALEARAAGLPVVALLASGVRDFVRQGVDGLLARDDAELSRHIARIALDAPFRDYVRHRNSVSAPPYDWREVRAMHLDFYALAIDRRVAATG